MHKNFRSFKKISKLRKAEQGSFPVHCRKSLKYVCWHTFASLTSQNSKFVSLICPVFQKNITPEKRCPKFKIITETENGRRIFIHISYL